MNRTAAAFLSVVRRRGPAWPFGLGFRVLGCRLSGLPRGLVVEPSEGCTGGCANCHPPVEPVHLDPAVFERWLDARPAQHATIHLAGRHSDPLSSPHLGPLVGLARARSSMVSISTLGLGMTPAVTSLPVDRWLISLPAATGESWMAVKGVNRLQEALEAVRMLRAARTGAMVEVILTKWSGSAGDAPAFARLAHDEGWDNTRIVHAFYDPLGGEYGRQGALALDEPDCPYRRSEDGGVELRLHGALCPHLDYLCLDARGGLRPCPIAGGDAPVLYEPFRESWFEAASWKARKTRRSFRNCTICP